MAIIKYVIVIVSVWVSLTGVAGAETLKCELHIASSLTKLIGPVSPPVFEDTIEAAQQGGVGRERRGAATQAEHLVEHVEHFGLDVHGRVLWAVAPAAL